MKRALILSSLLLALHSSWGAGRQLTGQHAPASTPALSPADAQKKFTLPEGFEIRLFASEPDVINPVAMTWDARGRLWVVELYEYPLGAAAGAKPRDRIKILEDTDGDGKADKVTVFADGLNLATAIQLGYGGVYVGQAPDLLFLEDTDGDGVADKRTVLKSGFGMEDRHELLNSFTWGPDGWLYMTHGVFTFSKVKDPNNPADSGVQMTAAVARFHPRTKKFEVVSDGTSNPWGVDFDRSGNAFVSACVIDHMFHMVPGGVYVRQGGVPENPYTYELLPSIVDHKHHMAAYAGVQIYQGNQFPEEYKGTILIGNIHDNAIHQDRLTPNGSSFKSSFIKDFVRANDGWFMPVSTQVGPDGAVWIMDWYDKYPCYQNANADPEGVDREHGRIWRVVYTGNEKGKPIPSRPEVNMDLAKFASIDLVKLLDHPNVWQRRMAQRLLSERRDWPGGDTLHHRTPLHDLMKNGSTLEARLAALWSLHGSDLLEDGDLDVPSEDKEPAMRAWAARITGERGYPLGDAIKRLAKLAEDKDPTVRLAVATAARQFVSGSLTVDTPPSVPIREVITGPILSALWFSSFDGKDPLIPFMYWMALEPIVAYDPFHAIGFYQKDGAMPQMPLAGILLTKIMRRVCDLQNQPTLSRAVLEFGKIPESAVPALTAGLRGLVEGQRGGTLIPSSEAIAVISRLSASPNAEVAQQAQQLGALWGDAVSLKAILARITDASATDDERVKAIQSVRQTKTDATRSAMLQALAAKPSDSVTVEAIRALSEIGGDDVAGAIVERWKDLSPAARRAASEVLVSRRNWTREFLVAVEKKTIAAAEIPATVLRSLSQSKDETIRAESVRVIGRFREPNADKVKLIAEKKAMILQSTPDLEAGHEIAKKTCFTCHKLYGEGADVGPDLTGVGRSSMDALLANVIDPNQIIGKGYENVEIETKDGRSVSGRLVEENEARIKLLSAGPKEEVIAKSDIASKRISEMSVMPEGLEQMPDNDFRNLIWFIYNPPQEKKRSGLDLPKKDAIERSAIDGESIALWNPEWKVVAPDFEGSPAKLPEFEGRRNVLMTHPFDQQKGAALERSITIPSGRKTVLVVNVAAHEQGDWDLHVLVDGKVVKNEKIDHDGERWKTISVELTPYGGQKISLRLENCANDWHYEFGYWNNLQIRSTDVQEVRR